MKRALILLLTILVATPLALGIMAGLAYYSTSADHIPRPTITLLEQEVKPSGYHWRSPIFGGLVYRDFIEEVPGRIQDIGEVTGTRFTISVPTGYESNATLTRMGETVWSGRAAELADFEFQDSGRYRILVECVRPTDKERGHGSLFYQGAFSVSVAPRYEASDDWVTQGDVLAIRVYNLDSTQQVRAESDLGNITFVQTEVGQMTAYVPVGHDNEPGSYVIYAGAGPSNWEIPLRVSEGAFERELLELEAGDSWPQNASDAPQGYPDYQEHILPLMDQQDNTCHWDGAFIDPVFGETLAGYGTLYQMGATGEVQQHPGLDIAADRGDEVMAANNGRVVFAAELESTGNTVVIEHGGGLKTYYYHLDTIAVQPDAMVTGGETIGTVGSTGTCRQPHLHFEARIGHATLNPLQLFSGSSRLFYFD